MMRIKRQYFFLVIFVFALISTKVHGQASLVGRLFFVHFGDVYSWNVGESEPTRHTTDGYYANLTLSPDGTQLAMRSILPEGWNSSYYDAANLWLLDLQTDTLRQITTNVEPANSVDGYISRSAPTWSPDGTQLAWTQWHFPEIGIMIYDVETGVTKQHSGEVSFGFADAGEYQSQEVFWGRYIAKAVFTFFEDNGAGRELSIYDDAGQRCVYQLDRSVDRENTSDEPTPTLDQWQWVEYNGAWWIGLQYDGLPYRLMNPDTGEQFEADQIATLHLLDTDAHAEAMRQREALKANTAANIPERVEWTTSLDGQYLASQISNNGALLVTVWHDGEAVITFTTPEPAEINVYTTAGLAWSWSAWRLPANAQVTVVEPLFNNRSGDCSE